MILVGVDEAGYGPLLGPLVVTATAFRVPDGPDPLDLWDVLRESVCREPARRDLRLPITDSKRLFDRKKGLAPLERTALVMLRAAQRRPRTVRELLNLLAPECGPDLGEYPWYAPCDTDLPRSIPADDVALRANALRRNLARTQVELRGVYTEVLPEGHFNRQVERLHNKAVVLSGMTLRVIQRARARLGAELLRVSVDRQGGREHYVDGLLTFFEGTQLRVLEESEARSAYELTTGGPAWTIEFVTRGESHHLPVALASIYSKYVRELLMEAFNAWFAARVQNLAPTAGYYTDGQRFLADIDPVIRAEGLDPTRLVRCR